MPTIVPLNLLCLTSRTETNGDQVLYGLSLAEAQLPLWPSDPTYILVRSNPNPSNAQSTEWTIVDSAPKSSISGGFRPSDDCTIDQQGVFTALGPNLNSDSTQRGIQYRPQAAAGGRAWKEVQLKGSSVAVRGTATGVMVTLDGKAVHVAADSQKIYFRALDSNGADFQEATSWAMVQDASGTDLIHLTHSNNTLFHFRQGLSKSTLTTIPLVGNAVLPAAMPTQGVKTFDATSATSDCGDSLFASAMNQTFVYGCRIKNFATVVNPGRLFTLDTSNSTSAFQTGTPIISDMSNATTTFFPIQTRAQSTAQGSAQNTTTQGNAQNATSIPSFALVQSSDNRYTSELILEGANKGHFNDQRREFYTLYDGPIGQESSSANISAAVLSAVVGVIVLICLVLCCWCFRSSRRNKRKQRTLESAVDGVYIHQAGHGSSGVSFSHKEEVVPAEKTFLPVMTPSAPYGSTTSPADLSGVSAPSAAALPSGGLSDGDMDVVAAAVVVKKTGKLVGEVIGGDDEVDVDVDCDCDCSCF